ncbi:hypothetical protein SAMN05428962_2759 [Paenibacillus sp. BC26]|nr:hypothetical protein SAMN05428962_2759 [Paenibacillus sp. BC26]
MLSQWAAENKFIKLCPKIMVLSIYYLRVLNYDYFGEIYPCLIWKCSMGIFIVLEGRISHLTHGIYWILKVLDFGMR